MTSSKPVLVLRTTLTVVLACFVGCKFSDDALVDGSLVDNGNVNDNTSGGTGDTPFPDDNSAFTENLIQSRTFTHGTAVVTSTHQVTDITRRPIQIDFNRDGKVDPVISYGETTAVVQILYSRGAKGVTDFLSLTLDSKRDMENLADVAVGDIDGDGNLDICGAAEGAVWYLHHPSDGNTLDLAAWGNLNPDDELRERIDGSYALLTDAELEAIIAQALGPGVNLDDYIVTIEQLYTNVEIGDFDNDGDNDIASSRSFIINLNPKPDIPVEPVQIVDGDVLVFANPGFATDGHGWTAVSAGRHERQTRLDRDGAAGLLACDMDSDGDLDLVSAASKDNNAQVAWFENPGTLDPATAWPQWRVGSVRNAYAIDIFDLTGDGKPDVVATGTEQQQLMLFEQPADTPKRTYDWNTYVVATFEAYDPLDVKAVDIDDDGVKELVVSATQGAVRYFEVKTTPRDVWDAKVVTTYDPPGDVGLLGYGDLDGDGDIDIIAVLSPEDDNASRVTWIRNDLGTAP
ncbi:FG-GAP repeat protein [Phycisphaerae bacterium RAS1]|nr:FG-GAP repeat protein [Phycisphaerae bacterium RAS1]